MTLLLKHVRFVDKVTGEKFTVKRLLELNSEGNYEFTHGIDFTIHCLINYDDALSWSNDKWIEEIKDFRLDFDDDDMSEAAINDRKLVDNDIVSRLRLFERFTPELYSPKMLVIAVEICDTLEETRNRVTQEMEYLDELMSGRHDNRRLPSQNDDQTECGVIELREAT